MDREAWDQTSTFATFAMVIKPTRTCPYSKNYHGGAEQLLYSQRSLAERALWLEYWLQKQEATLAEGRFADFNLGQWVQAANSLQGIFSRLGIAREASSKPSITVSIPVEDRSL